MVILALFPWRLFFFFAGLLGFGPQNVFLKFLVKPVDASQNKRDADLVRRRKKSLVKKMNQSLFLGLGRESIRQEISQATKAMIQRSKTKIMLMSNTLRCSRQHQLAIHQERKVRTKNCTRSLYLTTDLRPSDYTSGHQIQLELQRPRL